MEINVFWCFDHIPLLFTSFHGVATPYVMAVVCTGVLSGRCRRRLLGWRTLGCPVSTHPPVPSWPSRTCDVSPNTSVIAFPGACISDPGALCPVLGGLCVTYFTCRHGSPLLSTRLGHALSGALLYSFACSLHGPQGRLRVCLPCSGDGGSVASSHVPAWQVLLAQSRAHRYLEAMPPPHDALVCPGSLVQGPHHPDTRAWIPGPCPHTGPSSPKARSAPAPLLSAPEGLALHGMWPSFSH